LAILDEMLDNNRIAVHPGGELKSLLNAAIGLANKGLGLSTILFAWIASVF
jgi:hypothetical protein